MGLHGPVVRKKTTDDHQPLLGPCPFAFETRLNTACDHLKFYWTFLPVSHRQARPPLQVEGFPPRGHRLPWGLWPPSAPLIRRQGSLQVAHHGGAGHPQHIPLTALAQRVTKPAVAPSSSSPVTQPWGTCSPHASSISKHCAWR